MKRNTWFRFYSEALDDPKVQRLHPTLFKAWIGILCLASESGGKLPSVDDIAFRLRVSAHDAAQMVDELIFAGLIDIDPKGQRTPHNWASRQFVSDSSTGRSQKHRENKKKRECNVAETLPETPPDQIIPETDTDSEPDQTAQAREGSKEILDDLGVGRGGSVSVDAKRQVCRELNIGNAEPLVTAYHRWKPSQKAKNPDAMFISQAEKFYRALTYDMRKACQPLDAEPPPGPLPPVQASSSIRNSRLVKGFRNA